VANSSPFIASMKDVSHVYGKVTALDAINVDLPAGKMLGLIGPDGVGKSTLLGLLSGSRKIQSGSIQALDGDMRSVRHRRMTCQKIAYMPQGLGKNLYQELSIRENLDFFGKLFEQGPEERASRIHHLTKATGLDAFLDRPAGKLSGGMKQKLGLCCALIHDPDFLILDEPTTGVDPLFRQQFWELIKRIRSERPSMSVLVSTAYMEEADRFDWLIAMNAGHILATGSPDEVKTATGTDSLEAAFVQLLPEEERSEAIDLTIPPFEPGEHNIAIQAKGLTRRFGNFTAVDNVSFDIRCGEIFGFTGSNGCGKSTTMKVMTGLLPASEGEALLFGKALDANDLETRQRVGYMSQSFSLYGELTVSQNLYLHARLYHLPPETIDARVAELIETFDLKSYAQVKSGALPLGIRQRLSLAVAVVHKPEMLILDEPTSGVDPVARDAFWTLLVSLSRKDKVTIFISTHFMNEAQRCDRIALMHAGKVLACDTPAALAKSKGTEDLETAFVAYLSEAIGEDSGTSGTPKLGFDDGAKSARSPLASSMVRLLAYASREFREIIRDPVRLTFSFLGSVILLLIIGYGITTDVNNLTFAVLDQDRTPESRSYISQFSSSAYFTEKEPITDASDLHNRLVSGDISLALELPSQFGKQLKSGAEPEVSAWIDGANTIRSGTIEGYVTGAHYSFLKQKAAETGIDASQLSPADIETRFLYNPSFKSLYAIGPGVPAILLLMFPAILMGLSIAKEKETGTITNFYVAPTRRLEFLLGKQLPYVAIGFVNFVILTFIVVAVFQVPLKGSLLALSLGALVYVTVTSGYGMLVSTFTPNQVVAVLATAVISMMPTIQYSGLIEPISTLQPSGRLIGTFWPSSHYLHLNVGAFTKGLEFHSLLPDILALLAFIPFFTIASALLLQKQEK